MIRIGHKERHWKRICEALGFNLDFDRLFLRVLIELEAIKHEKELVILCDIGIKEL